MAIFSSYRNKIILLLLISILIFTGWQYGLETVYAKILVGATNVSLSIVKDATYIELEKIESSDGLYQFVIHTLFDGAEGIFPQETGSMMEPFVIILSWQIFIFFILKRRSALRSSVINVGSFFIIQIIFMIFLTGYHTSSLQRYLYVAMMDIFYVVALILIIKDNMLYPVFRKG